MDDEKKSLDLFHSETLKFLVFSCKSDTYSSLIVIVGSSCVFTFILEYDEFIIAFSSLECCRQRRYARWNFELWENVRRYGNYPNTIQIYFIENNEISNAIPLSLIYS